MTQIEKHLTIALVGRPNVGKSTLFNRLVGKKRAIVDDTPGMTVDRHYAQATFYEYEYTLIDTGGFEPEAEDELRMGMRAQSLLAIEEADIIFALFDGKEGLIPDDEEIVRNLRQSGKAVYYLVNKVDGPKHAANVADFYSLGIDPLYAISAEHGVNVGELVEEVEANHPSCKAATSYNPDECRLAVIGRPNVGKSTIVNRFLGHERHLVTDIAGTTRDAIDSVIEREGKTYRVIDTAGIRRQKKVSKVFEKRTIVKALKAMDRADIALLMVDAREGVTEQDLKIAGFAHDKGLASMIVVNKWDLVEKDSDTAGSMAKEIRDRMKFNTYAPIIFISAKTGQRVETILKHVDKIFIERGRRISTGELNRWLERSIKINQPPTRKGKTLKIYYLAQVDIAPPTFMVSVNDPDLLHFSYKRFLSNRLREAFGFDGVPIKLFARSRGRGDPRTAEEFHEKRKNKSKPRLDKKRKKR